jgi:hypothetical protein
MRGRGLLLGASAFAVVGSIGFTLAQWLRPAGPGAGITRQNKERILKGMTEAEVEAILGGPVGNYSGKQADELATLELITCSSDEIERFLQSQRRELPADTLGQYRASNRRPAPTDPLVARLWVGDAAAVLVFFRSGRADACHAQSLAHGPAFLACLRGLFPW